MAGGFANFMVGMGTGYLARRDKEYERARQEKDDAWREKQRQWQEDAQKEAAADKQAIRDATAPRATMQGTAVTDGAGNANLYKDPAQAAAAAKEMRIEAEMRGQSPTSVMEAPATGVTGSMSQGHQITAGPVDVAALNSRDAQYGRVAEALIKRGKPIEALGMENAVIDNTAKKLGLKREELSFADQLTRRAMDSALREGPTWYAGAANFVTKSQMPGVKDVKGDFELSPDGKTVTLFSVMPDGTREARGTYDAGDKGQMDFMQKFGQLPIETRMTLMNDRIKQEYQKGRDKVKDENDAARLALEDRRTTAAERQAATAEKRLTMLEATRIGGGGGGGNGSTTQPAGMPDPMAGFDSKKAFAAATDQAIAELGTDPAKPATAQAIARRATEIVRAMESEFQATGVRQIVTQAFERTAATAKTPDELASVFQRGIAAGLAPQEMAALDPRFAAFAQKAASAEKKDPNGSGAATGNKSQGPGVFTDKTGQIQLMQPLFNLNEIRRRMQEQANQAQN